MKKITGKVVSLVLALALVVTSFSGTFAFASTKSVSGTVSDTDNDEIYLVNGNDTKKDVTKLMADWINPTLDTKDHQDVDGLEISAISHASGDSLVKWDIEDGDATLSVKSSSKTGTEVLSVLYEGTYTNDDGDDVTVKARKNFTVHVLDEGSLVVGKTYKDSGTVNQHPRTGKDIEKPDTFAQTYGTSVEVTVYKVGKDSDAKAYYTPATVTSNEKATSGDAYVSLSSNENVYFDEATTAALAQESGTTDPLTIKVGKGTDRDKDASVSNITVTAKAIVDGKVSDDSDDKYTLKTKVEKKVDAAQAATNADMDKATAFSIDTDHGTQLYATKDGTTKKIATVTDCEVVFPNGTATVSVDDGSVKKISGTVGALTINDDASVGSVDATGDVAVDGGKVGDITTVGNVKVTSGKTGNIDNTDDSNKGTVTINGGTVGTIDSDSTVELTTTDEDTPITAGKVTANTVTVFADEAKVSVNGIKVTDDNSSIKVEGSDVTIGTVDMDYREDATLTLGDEDDTEFVGTIVAPVNAKNGKIETENEDTVATVSGTVDVDTISIGSDTTVTFTGNVTVDSIDGDGTMKIAAGSLYVTGGVSGTTLKLTDANLAVGTTVFKADSDAVDADDFETYGFTLVKNEGSSVDTFKIASLAFAGLQVNKSASKIAKGYSETFTASAYPTGTVIPSDAKVVWDFDGNDDVFEVTTSDNTATVKVLSIDPDFASENTATLTAKLQDEDGYDLDDYGTADIALTAIAVPDAKSDTTTNFTVAQGASYTMKVTSATAPSVTLGTAGVFAVTTTKNGNDYFYKFVPTGKVGASTGVYLNGTKLLVASVGAPAFKSDTTVAIKVAAGKSYTYKITASAAPSFGFGTGNVFSVTKISKVGNDYFFTVAPVANAKSGAATGVYVNGVKVNVATVA